MGIRRVPSLHLQPDFPLLLHQTCLHTAACWTPRRSPQIPDSTFPKQVSSCCAPSPALSIHAQPPRTPKSLLQPMSSPTSSWSHQQGILLFLPNHPAKVSLSLIPPPGGNCSSLPTHLLASLKPSDARNNTNQNRHLLCLKIKRWLLTPYRINPNLPALAYEEFMTGKSVE